MDETARERRESDENARRDLQGPHLQSDLWRFLSRLISFHPHNARDATIFFNVLLQAWKPVKHREINFQLISLPAYVVTNHYLIQFPMFVMSIPSTFERRAPSSSLTLSFHLKSVRFSNKTSSFLTD